jgi:hypothetical protein
MECCRSGREVRKSGFAATISDSTIWRWLHEDAIRPWCYRSWIFLRDPQFAEKAGRILDLCCAKVSIISDKNVVYSGSIGNDINLFHSVDGTVPITEC